MRNNRSRAFTLVELLVVMGIIVLLVSILLPTVMRSFKSANKLRTAADLQTIAVALEAYKQDFGDIPRLPVYPTGDPSGSAGNSITNTGAAVLCKALLGPYGVGNPPLHNPSVAYKQGDVVTVLPDYWVAVVNTPAGPAPTATDAKWAKFDVRDFSDGPGFKVRSGAGKVWGPYIQPGKVKNQGVFFLDHSDGPILYFPARPGATSVTKKELGSGPQPYVAFNTLTATNTSLYNASDNIENFRRSSEADAETTDRIRIMLGNYSAQGFIDSTKGDVAVNQPYLLWTPGPDGFFGPLNYPVNPADTIASQDPSSNQRAVSACDDVTNFGK